MQAGGQGGGGGGLHLTLHVLPRAATEVVTGRAAAQARRAHLVCSLTFHYLVIHSLFTGENQVEQVSAVLESFGPRLDPLISVQHM